LSTHNGSIDYTGTLADMEIETHNGSIDIQCTGQSEKPCKIDVETHNGGITFTAPENFSATVEASTGKGDINTDLPVAITGEVSKKLKGVIGDGRDKLRLETHNGSIKIK